METGSCGLFCVVSNLRIVNRMCWPSGHCRYDNGGEWRIACPFYHPEREGEKWTARERGRANTQRIKRGERTHTGRRQRVGKDGLSLYYKGGSVHLNSSKHS